MRRLAESRADRLNAFITTADAARLEAPADNMGRLAGLAIGVKDNIAVRGMRMTCASAMLSDYVAPYDATVVERIVLEGGRIVGKTNLDEFACGSSGESSHFGPTLNPIDVTRVPGGSSSGSGAAVAGGLVDIAVGSDTGGSVRCPAAFCGVVAMKPSYGLVSRYGLADMCMSLEGPAPMAPDVYGCALLLSVMAGRDERDLITSDAVASDFTTDLDALDLDGFRIGLPIEFFDGVEPEIVENVRSAADRFASKGAIVTDVSIPASKKSLAAYYLLTYSEFASAMQRYDGFRYGVRGDGKSPSEAAGASRSVFGREVKRRILLGTYVTMREHRDSWYTAALNARRLVRRDFAKALAEVDVLFAPTMPFPAFKLGSRIEDPVKMYAADVLTVSANLAGSPAGSVPLGGNGLPTGLQVMGRPGDDRLVLQTMRKWETLR
ncbi:MAG: Asp-tRNA(Asn)/Glu-tRNA(Gln) amidotransferase subunit GatA [Euryarchaeota archaeon]|nr:Asp-tRNA(Asn)/Glu-tRNA(Gln) amidotransferase subunit GatA [Euryarchaeota archaeon]